MRIVGLVLVILGALALGYGGFTYVTTEEVTDAGVAEVVEKRKTVWIPPVAGGIALVTGLIILVTTSERD